MAAKNVQCIHTSSLAGTTLRQCHQDWMMGKCGKEQPAQNWFKWLYCKTTHSCDTSLHESHGLCPLFYNSAFKNDFIADNSVHKCSSDREPTEVPKNFKMGYMEMRKSWVPQGIAPASAKVQLFWPIFSSKVYGDFFAPTSEKFPWNVATAAIKNKAYDAENLINAETWHFSNDLNALVW